MFKLTPVIQGSTLPLLKAAIVAKTKDGETHRIRIKVNFPDLCLMGMGYYWVTKYIDFKASKWVKDRFARMETIGFESVSIDASDIILADMNKGLKHTSANLSWKDHATGDTGVVRLSGPRLFQMAQVTYDECICARDIKTLVGQQTMDTIVEANGLTYPELLTWSLRIADDDKDMARLQRYFKRLYEGIDY